MEKSISLYPQIPLKASPGCWEPCNRFWETCQDSQVPGSVTHIIVGGWEMIYTSAAQAIRAGLGCCHQCRLHQCTVPTAPPKTRAWWQNQAWNHTQTLKPPPSAAPRSDSAVWWDKSLGEAAAILSELLEGFHACTTLPSSEPPALSILKPVVNLV